MRKQCAIGRPASCGKAVDTTPSRPIRPPYRLAACGRYGSGGSSPLSSGGAPASVSVRPAVPSAGVLQTPEVSLLCGLTNQA